MHVDNKGKNIKVLAEGTTQEWDDTTLTAEAKYSINFTQSGKRFVLNLHYNGRNSFLFVNATKLYKFKVKNSDIKDYVVCLVNVSNNFTINNMKKAGLKGVVNFFSVGFNPIDNIDMLDIHKYLMKSKWHKIKFGLIKKIFTGLLTGLVSGSNDTKWVS